MTTAGPIHPFLGFTAFPPNGGRPVTCIEDLDADEREMLAEIAPQIDAAEDLPMELTERPIIDESWSLQDIALKAAPRGWEPVFRKAAPELAPVDGLLRPGEYYPSKTEMFTAFELCPLHRVRVVIVGQDPYHDGSAMGMAFSTRRGRKIPPSLQTIFKEITTSMPDTGPFNHGDLTKWAQQGVLLLNMALSVKPKEPKSHFNTGKWVGFLTTIVQAVLTARPRTIFVLWGNIAAGLVNDGAFGLKEDNSVLRASHPSPLNRSAAVPFLGCGHFVKINSMLQDMGEDPINWNV